METGGLIELATPLGVLLALVLGIGAYLRSQQKESAEDAQRQAQAQERRDLWMQGLVEQMGRQSREDSAAMQELIKQNGKSSQAMAQGLDTVCATMEAHEVRTAERHSALIAKMQGS